MQAVSTITLYWFRMIKCRPFHYEGHFTWKQFVYGHYMRNCFNSRVIFDLVTNVSCFHLTHTPSFQHIEFGA